MDLRRQLPRACPPKILIARRKPALCRFEWVTNEKERSAETLAEVQNCFTTKDTKSTKEEDEALDHALKPGGVVAGPVYYILRSDIEVHQESGLHSHQPQRDTSGSSSSLCNAFLCVLCSFARGTSFSSCPFVALTLKPQRYRDTKCSAPSAVKASASLRRRGWWNSLRYPLETTRNLNPIQRLLSATLGFLLALRGPFVYN